MLSQLIDATQPYSDLEALVYDAVIAPAVEQLTRSVRGELLPALPHGGTLLDVGCGGGHLLAEVAASRPDASLVGVDLSASQVARARRRAGRPGVRVERGSALDLPLESGAFDAVVSVASIKHWPDPRRGLSECLRVLRPGGLLAVAEVDRGCLWADAVSFVKRWRLPSPLWPASLSLFRAFVAGQSIDLEDARALLSSLGGAAAEGSVKRVAGTPALLLTARKAWGP